MNPLLAIQFTDLSDYPRQAAPVMAVMLEAIAASVRKGEASGRVTTDEHGTAEWTIHTEVTFDDLKQMVERCERLDKLN